MTLPGLSAISPRRQAWIGLLLVTFIGYFTYMHNYAYPAQFFWDENYHVAAAQKYLNGIYFMEPHPPLGKLLIAAGELVIHANEKNDQFIGTDYGSTIPMGFSFAGYRFFPVLLAWLAAPVVFLIFLFLSRNALHAVLLSSLYLFDNAFIVHMRGAMLEGPLMFFSALTLLFFLLILEWNELPRKRTWAAVGFGLALGAAVMTKVFALILGIPALAVIVVMRKQPRALLHTALVSAIAFFMLCGVIWQAHFGIASRVNPNLPDDGYYQASQTYKNILQNGEVWNPLAFPVMVRDHLNFVGHYERGVPKLDMCKADENGSPFFLWPVGATSISYRWETPDSTSYQYLYLQSNPVVWGLGLLALLLGISFSLSAIFIEPRKNAGSIPLLLTTFIGMYAGFMLVISHISRVMYLYHYFMPLLFTLFMLPLVLRSIRRFGPWTVSDVVRTPILVLMTILIFAGFQFYRPFSYYEPITDEAVQRRALLKVWQLHCVRCSYDRVFGTPRAPTNS